MFQYLLLILILHGSMAVFGSDEIEAAMRLPLNPAPFEGEDDPDVEEEASEAEAEDENAGRVNIGLRGDYQRVDGLMLGLDQEFKSRSEHGFRVHFAEAYAFHRNRWFYEAGFEVPLLPRGFLVLGADVFRRTSLFNGFDDRIISDMENALAALLIKEDYRDYFEEEGGSVFLRQPLWPGNAIEAGYLQSSHDPLDNHTRTSLTRWDEDFRPNPVAEPGELHAFTLRFERDTRVNERPWGSTQWHRIEWERADGGTGGDFDYSRLIADLRHYAKLSPGHLIWGRVLYATNLSGRLPPQKQFALGGISTLRAHEFKEFTGDQALLTNLEYRFGISKDFNLLTFVDVGATAFGEGQLDNQRFAFDGGFGAGTRNERAFITVAHDLHRSDGPFMVSFRLGSAF
jgi:outer membrane protein assembly factor BamA